MHGVDRVEERAGQSHRSINYVGRALVVGGREDLTIRNVGE